MAIRISEKTTGNLLGEVSDHDLAVLTGYMEEESSTDQDYYVESMAIDALAQRGASGEFIALLKGALGTADGVDIAWSRD